MGTTQKTLFGYNKKALSTKKEENHRVGKRGDYKGYRRNMRSKGEGP
jgi:hypothetical protein